MTEGMSIHAGNYVACLDNVAWHVEDLLGTCSTIIHAQMTAVAA